MSSSIHIQKVNAGSFLHNDRTMKVSYLIDTPDKNECSTPSAIAIKQFNELKAMAMKNYTERTHQKMQKNTIFLKEAIVNLQEHHTLEDLEPIKEKLESYGFTVLQMSIHRDEGFVNKDNKKEKNFHAHITMFNLDIATGKTIKFGKSYRSELSRLQTFVAKTLKMQRGKVSVKEEAKRLNVKLSKATRRLDTHDYKRAMKIKEKELELQEQEQYNFREYQKKITALENLSSEQKKELHRLNSAAKKDAEKIAELREALEKQKRLNDELEQEKNAKYNQVKIFNKIFTKIAQEFDVETKSYGQIRDDVISKYISAKQQVVELKETINTQKTTISTLWKEKGDLRLQVIENQKFEQSYNFVNSKNVELMKKLRSAEKTIGKLEKEKSDLEQQVSETQKAEQSYNFVNSKNDELQEQLKISRETIDTQKTTIDTLRKENSDLRARFEELRDAFTEITQALSIKFNSAKQVVADIVSKFKSTKVEPEVEPVKEVDDDVWKHSVESAYKVNRQNKFPKLK